jgi:hypothetical protein
VTIAKRPSVYGHGTAGLMDVIWAKREGIYFYSEDWTGSISLNGFGNSCFSRNQDWLVAA